MRTGSRLTRRGRIAAAVVVTLLGTGLVAGYRALAGPADCSVTVGERVVELDRDRAERLTTDLSPGDRSLEAATERAARLAGLGRADARVVASAVTGRSRAALSCRSGGAGSSEADGLDDAGLTHRAAVVRSDLASVFGDLPLGGFEPGGVSTGHMPGSAHYEGRAIDVFFRPISKAHKRPGWALAQYFVAHADRLAVETVIFDGRIWTAARAAEGWRDYRVNPDGRPVSVVRVLEHRDHVHVDVSD